MGCFLVEDLRRVVPGCPAWAAWCLAPVVFLGSRGFRAVALYRISRACFVGDSPLEAQVFSVINEELHGVAIHPSADLGAGLSMPMAFGVVIGPGVVAGPGLTLHVGTGIAASGNRAPMVGDDVTLLAGAQVVGGVSVGDRVLVYPKSVVSMNVESDCVSGPAGAMG